MGRIVFFFSEAFRALRRSAAPSIAAIVTIVITTLLLGVLVPVLHASESKASEVRDQIGLKVFLYRDATQASKDELAKKLNGLPHVTGVTYCSPTCAKKDLLSRLHGDLQGSMDVLFHQEHGLALPVELPDQFEDPVDVDRRQAERRLVQQQQPRPRHQRSRDRELLLLAARERARELRSPFGEDREPLEPSL
jgi:hypothetical protein